jgi:hypothetical protein
MLLHTCWRAPGALARLRCPPQLVLSLGDHTTHRRFSGASSAVAEAPSADLIDWPDGLKPKRGGITRAALSRLKVKPAAANLPTSVASAQCGRQLSPGRRAGIRPQAGPGRQRP